MKNIEADQSFFIPFKKTIQGINLPNKFTFPFYYDAHPLSILAAEELQEYLNHQNDWEHNFGLRVNQDGLVIGKMFGVLVVKNKDHEIGYLAAFSGKLAGTNNHKIFVPPVFDMLEANSFFLQEEEVLNAINKKIAEAEINPRITALKISLLKEKEQFNSLIQEEKEKLKKAKSDRKKLREEAKITLNDLEYQLFEQDLIKQSLRDKYEFKVFSENAIEKHSALFHELQALEDEINYLKDLRKEKSAALQEKLFNQYQFLNINKEVKSLQTIFKNTVQQKPPAAAGECAAPKLLQYAFRNDLKPICMAEFWWGQSPKSEIRKHKNFYPACTGKCEPILTHMLKGMKVDKNPLLENKALDKDLEIVYEDDYLLVINKPEEFLSVPGINVKDSVYERMKLKFPNASGPLIVHRLDMSTSGILLIAKDKATHKFLQNQFIKRTIRKRYLALLDGNLKYNEGIINLPLRVDLEDRPRQLVCYEYGKPAETEWKVLERKDGKTKVLFYPITGRTHQLRVHAAHSLGLNAPIVGDDLYGSKSNRLHLHAQWIQFKHPQTKEIMEFEVGTNF